MDRKNLDYGFPTVFGRNLVGELPNIMRPPFLVVTMDDLWDKFAHHFAGTPHEKFIVRSIDVQGIAKHLAEVENVGSVVGIGGGQALDTAKYVAWQRNIPIFQVPTALSTNAAFGQRSGLRDGDSVIYRGWAVPEAVFIDWDIIQSAPKQMNYSGICEILCLHTGVLDWKYATAKGKCEDKWPYDEHIARQSLSFVDDLLANLDNVRDLNEKGIRTLVNGLRWGTSFFGNGWNPRHIEGIDHFVFYALEAHTGKKFLHGQPVCLGIIVGCMLHNSRTEEMLKAITHIGLDMRPEAMGITWEQVEQALLGLADYVREKQLWHSIAHDANIDSEFVAKLREVVTAAYA